MFGKYKGKEEIESLKKKKKTFCFLGLQLFIGNLRNIYQNSKSCRHIFQM